MFEDLIESRHDTRRFLLSTALPLALGLHVVGFAAFWICSFFQVPAIGEPPLVVSFSRVVEAPPPPPPPPAAIRSATPITPIRTERRPAPDVKVRSEIVPEADASVKPEIIPEAPAIADVDRVAGTSDDLGNPFGVAGGEVGGIPGGVVGGAGTGPAPEAPAGPLRIGGDVLAPRVLQRAFPDYPPLARSAQVEGIVVLEAVIHRDGTAGNIRVVRGLRLGCSEAAVDALRRWRFAPGTRSGAPVDVYMTLEVTFKLD